MNVQRDPTRIQSKHVGWLSCYCEVSNNNKKEETEAQMTARDTRQNIGRSYMNANEPFNSRCWAARKAHFVFRFVVATLMPLPCHFSCLELCVYVY